MTTTWEHQLDIDDVFHDDQLTVQQKTDAIVARIKAGDWYAELAEDLAPVLEELNDAAEADDVEWWDQVWDAFYDIADAARIWVKTR